MDDVREHLPMSVHTWVVRDRGRTILIDTGVGNGKDRPFAPYFDRLDTRFLERLRAAGAAPEDVDFVLMTHVHVDHVGWNTRLHDGVWTPTFPNARYVFSRAEHAQFKDSRNLNERNRTSFAVQLDSFDPVIAAGLAMAIDVDGSEAIPGFRFHATPGHSPYHASIAFESDGRNALFAGCAASPGAGPSADAQHPVRRRTRGGGAIAAWALHHACERDAQVFSSHSRARRPAGFAAARTATAGSRATRRRQTDEDRPFVAARRCHRRDPFAVARGRPISVHRTVSGQSRRLTAYADQRDVRRIGTVRQIGSKPMRSRIGRPMAEASTHRWPLRSSTWRTS